jgi:hypothetical protein
VLARAPLSPTEILIEGLDALRPQDVRHLAAGLRALLAALDLRADEPPMLFEDGRTSGTER